jgi:hypothetical protein
MLAMETNSDDLLKAKDPLNDSFGSSSFSDGKSSSDSEGEDTVRAFQKPAASEGYPKFLDSGKGNQAPKTLDDWSKILCPKLHKQSDLRTRDEMLNDIRRFQDAYFADKVKGAAHFDVLMKELMRYVDANAPTIGNKSVFRRR